MFFQLNVSLTLSELAQDMRTNLEDGILEDSSVEQTKETCLESVERL